MIASTHSVRGVKRLEDKILLIQTEHKQFFDGMPFAQGLPAQWTLNVDRPFVLACTDSQMCGDE